VVEGGALSPDDQADAAQDAEALSVFHSKDAFPWKTIAFHGGEVAGIAARMAQTLGLSEPLQHALRLAGQWHDLGKAHPAFQGSIRLKARPERTDLAKAPNDAWSKKDRYRYTNDLEVRPGFRHELASALALFAVLMRHQPDHPALMGPWGEALRALEVDTRVEMPGPMAAPTPTEQAILALDDRSFDLVAYLVASHHGKVRAGMHAAPADQDYATARGDARGLPIRGVREGDALPSTLLEPGLPPLPALSLTLEPAMVGLSLRTGASWTERVQGLIATYGPGGLALLEACLRAADIRASRLNTSDPLLAVEERR